MKYSVVLTRFDGGLNTKVSPALGRPDESPSLQNVVFDDFGAVETRTGYSAAVSAALSAFGIDMIKTYVKNDGTAQLLVACADLLLKMSSTTGVTIPSAQSVFTHGVPLQSTVFQNQMWLSNGYATPHKWNGTEFTRWGISAPSAATAAINSAGALTGYYKYVILGVSSNSANGNYGSATTEITLAAQRGYLTEIPVFATSEGVNTKLICRNTAAASGIYYIVTSIANAITVYADNNADTALSTFAPTDNGLPANFTVFISHEGRIFGASGSSLLWYSNINDPETFGSGDYIRVGEGDGFKITGLATLGNGIVISKNDNKGNGSIYFLYTPDGTPDNWTITKLGIEGGTQAVRVMEKFSNYIMYLNRYGVFDLNQAAVGDIRSDALSFNIEPDIYNLALSYINSAVAINWKNKVWISVPYGAVTANNYVYQYDYVRGRNVKNRLAGAWSKFTNMAFSDFTIHQGTLYAGHVSNGFIYTLDTGYNDNAAAIDSRFTTMLISGKPGHEANLKQWRSVYLFVECLGDWTMDLTYSEDFDGETGNIVKINLARGDFDWGQAGSDFGIATWGGLNRKKVYVEFSNLVSRTIQLRFSTNTADQYFKVHQAEIFYNLKGVR